MSPRLSLLLLVALAAPASASEPFQVATMDQVETWIAAGDAIVYDVNPEEVYAKNHLPGARFLAGKAWTKTLPEAKAGRLVFYCANPR
jgi:rhodanese-related sulfurtransferase